MSNPNPTPPQQQHRSFFNNSSKSPFCRLSLLSADPGPLPSAASRWAIYTHHHANLTSDPSTKAWSGLVPTSCPRRHCHHHSRKTRAGQCWHTTHAFSSPCCSCVACGCSAAKFCRGPDRSGMKLPSSTKFKKTSVDQSVAQLKKFHEWIQGAQFSFRQTLFPW